jgi:hypothetical protein
MRLLFPAVPTDPGRVEEIFGGSEIGVASDTWGGWYGWLVNVDRACMLE